MPPRRLWGKCGGQDITFSPGADGSWNAAVPSNPSGEYMIEVWAEDAAGNVGYLATLMLTYEPARRCVSTRIVETGETWSVETVTAWLGLAGPRCELRLRRKPQLVLPAIRAKFIRFECCGR